MRYPIRVAIPTPQLAPLRRVSTRVQIMAGGTISDFAALVRKSYSDTPSPVRTLVLVMRSL